MVKRKTTAKAMIAAHGYATASSMANVVNRLLQEDLFESLDMTLDVTPQQIAAEIVIIAETAMCFKWVDHISRYGISEREIHQFLKNNYL